MIAVDQIVGESVAVVVTAGLVCVAGAFGMVIEAVPDAAQQWTALGLLAALVVWLTRQYSAERSASLAVQAEMARAMANVATALAQLQQRETDAQRATEQKRIEIVGKLDEIADDLKEVKNRKP
jgi:hypothetical protein